MSDLSAMFAERKATVAAAGNITKKGSKDTSSHTRIYLFLRAIEDKGLFARNKENNGLFGLFDLSAMKDVPYASFDETPVGYRGGSVHSAYCWIYDGTRKMVMVDKVPQGNVEETHNRNLAAWEASKA